MRKPRIDSIRHVVSVLEILMFGYYCNWTKFLQLSTGDESLILSLSVWYRTSFLTQYIIGKDGKSSPDTGRVYRLPLSMSESETSQRVVKYEGQQQPKTWFIRETVSGKKGQGEEKRINGKGKGPVRIYRMVSSIIKM